MTGDRVQPKPSAERSQHATVYIISINKGEKRKREMSHICIDYQEETVHRVNVFWQ